jgi:hypothetical protein
MKSIAYPGFVKLVSLGISLYAVFLVLQRSADAEGEFKEPIEDVPGEASESVVERRTARRERKWRETKRNLDVVWHHIPFVLREASGALFYVLLILVSCVGVLLATPVCRP